MMVVPDLSILPQESDIPQEFDALSDQAAQIARLERLHVEQDHINIAQAAEIQCLNARVQRLISESTPGKFYAVARGRETGIFDNWPRAHTATSKYSGACFQGFSTIDEAEEFMASNVAAENETDRLKAEIGSLRDRVDHLQTAMEDSRMRYFSGFTRAEVDVAHQLEVAFTKLDHLEYAAANSLRLRFCSCMDLDD